MNNNKTRFVFAFTIFLSILIFHIYFGVSVVEENSYWQPFGLQDRKVYVLKNWEGTLYAGTDNGIYQRKITEPNPDSGWVHIGLENSEVYDLFIYKPEFGFTNLVIYAALWTSPNDRYVATNEHPFINEWEYEDGSLPGKVKAIVGKSDNPNILFVTTQATNMEVYRSQDGGYSWSSVLNIGTGLGFHDIVTSEAQPDTFWVGGESGFFRPILLKSPDSGINWEDVDIGYGGDNAVDSILVSYQNPNVIFLGMEGIVKKTSDGGITWRAVLDRSDYTRAYFNGLYQDLNNPNHILASGGSYAGVIDIYESTDGGETWNALPILELPDPGAGIVVLGSSSNEYYLATNHGVYKSEPGDKVDIDIVSGNNAISFPLIPRKSYKAQDVLDEIKNQGGDVSQIKKWDVGTQDWVIHDDGLPFGNFDINVGEGFFVLSSKDSTWSFYGEPPSQTLPVTMYRRYNFVSFPYLECSLEAESMCEEMRSQGHEIVEISRWRKDLGNWEGHVCGISVNNFQIKTTEPYFIKTNNENPLEYIPCSSPRDTTTTLPKSSTTTTPTTTVSTTTTLIDEPEITSFTCSGMGSLKAQCNVDIRELESNKKYYVYVAGEGKVNKKPAVGGSTIHGSDNSVTVVVLTLQPDTYQLGAWLFGGTNPDVMRDSLTFWKGDPVEVYIS